MKKKTKSDDSLPSSSRKSLILPAISSSPNTTSTLQSNSKYFRSSPRLNNTEKSKIQSIPSPAYSLKRCGYVLRYAANTHKGQFRNYNEDRLSIIINIPCPSSFKSAWPHSSFFGIYDGHGGKSCANFLKENLHKFIFDSEFFPSRPKQALFDGFNKAETEFISWAKENNDQSGSCAIVVMVLGKKCYVANTGDSRAVLSSHKGEKVLRLTKDHKPDEPGEYERIIQAGSSIVTRSFPVTNEQGARIGNNVSRVVPGNLAVSRSFGDRFIKGNGAVVNEPEIKSFRLTEDFDFILIGSDGIFDRVGDGEVVERVWKSFERERNASERICFAVEDVMRYAMSKGSEDNISVVLIVFKGLSEVIEKIVSI